MGIRKEASSGPGWRVAHSFEAKLAFIETDIRTFFNRVHVSVEVFELQLAGPFKSIQIPYINLAIALDVANSGTSSATSPITWSHTCTGSNGFLYVGGSTTSGNSTASTLGTVSYNSVSMSSARTDSNAAAFASASGVFFLAGPATGSNTVSVAFSGGFVPACGGGSTSYTGAQSTNTADASNGTSNTSTTGSQSFTVTTIADNCWIVCTLSNRGTSADTANNTSRWEAEVTTVARYGGEDTNSAVTPAGATTMGWTIAAINNTGWTFSGASFAPTGGQVTINTPTILAMMGIGM